MRHACYRHDQSYSSQAKFAASASSIKIALPTLAVAKTLDDAGREAFVLLEKHEPLKRSEIEKDLNTNKSKAARILKQFSDKELIEVEGTGRATRYRL